MHILELGDMSWLRRILKPLGIDKKHTWQKKVLDVTKLQKHTKWNLQFYV